MSFRKVRRDQAGFTLVELLAVVVILGIVSVIGITSVSRLIDKAKQDQKVQQEKTVSMAAESYLQANSNVMPKAIGEAKVIKLSDLKKSNYIREDVKNADGESCMNESFVRVYKYSKSKYTYSPYIYCGKEKAPSSTTTPKPGIKIQYFYKDSAKNSVEHVDDDVVTNNVSNAKVRIIFTGGENTDGSNLLLDGYTYSISVKKKEDSSLEEVYNSGTLNANYTERLVIEKSLSDYIDVVDTTSFVVRAYARNTAGGSFDSEKGLGEKSTSYDDKTPPTCSDISGEASGEDDWKTNAKDPRVITVKCNDGEGSKCLRGTFSKTWPNKSEPEAEYSWVTIEDNAGNKNITNCQYRSKGCCKVRVNVDYTSPTLRVEAYRRSSSGAATGKNILKVNSANAGRNGWDSSSTIFTAKQKDISYVINSNDYSKTNNGWFNAINYPNGIVYKVTVSDSVKLYRWEWKVNAPNSKANSALGGGSENMSGYFSSNNQTIYIPFENDGYRHGKLIVYDRALNATVINVYANLDKVAPKVPSLRDANQFRVNKVRSDGSGNFGTYAYGSWSKYYLKGEFVKNSAVDNINSNKLTLSGYSHYNYSFTNQDGKSSNDSTEDSYFVTIKSEGTGSFKANVCDKAGNCSAYSKTEVIKIDTKPPICSVEGGSTWTNKNVVVKARCSDVNDQYGSKCATADFEYEYNHEINTTVAGAMGVGQGGVVYDNAGNSTNCASDKTVQIDRTPPTCSVNGGSKSWTNGNRKITAHCEETEGSKCLTDDFSFTYDTELSIDNAGANGIGKGGTVYDRAGNSAACDANQIVRIDKTPPVCSVSGGSENWTKNSRTVNAHCDDDLRGITHSGCETMDFWYTYNASINTTTAGAKGVNNGGVIYDNAGNVTNCSANQVVRVDKDPPRCVVTGGNNNWTNEDVEITAHCEDGSSGSSCATEDFSKMYSSNTNTTVAGANGIGSGGMVYDHAGNSTSCRADQVVKIDKDPPSCEVKGGSKDWTSGSRKITAHCEDTGGSECSTADFSFTYDDEMNVTTAGAMGIGEGGSVSDHAGNTKDCDANQIVRIDRSDPECAHSGDSEVWTKKNRTISYGCSDDVDCKGSGKVVFSETTRTAVIPSYSIKDKAGNKIDCPKRTANVYVDKTPPVCTHKGDSKKWTKKDRTITYGCKDNESKCKSGSGGTVVFSTTTKVATIPAYSIVDKVGNKKDCPARKANVYVDKTAPSYVSGGTVSKGSVTDIVWKDDQSGVSSASVKYCFKTKKEKPVYDDDCFTKSTKGPTDCNQKIYVYARARDIVGNRTDIKLLGSYSTGPCCSKENPAGCNWVTSCRYGTTEIHGAGMACHVYWDQPWTDNCHRNGSVPACFWDNTTSCTGETKLYLYVDNKISTSGITYIAYKGGDGGSRAIPNDGQWHYGYILNNCIGNMNSTCQYSACPG